MSYSYRVDGMRVEKVDHSGNYQIGGGEVDDLYAWCRYDGQTPMETAITKADGSHEVIDNGLGARGMDYVQITQIPTSGSSTVTVAYPLYDAHGNEVATVCRSGASYALTNQRSYGAWGEIRQGAETGGPRGRYCGNLGHVQDDETGLVYMRARYYEPSSGRFISQDPRFDGANWFTYAVSNPVKNFDFSGRDTLTASLWSVPFGAAVFLAVAFPNRVILSQQRRSSGSAVDLQRRCSAHLRHLRIT